MLLLDSSGAIGGVLELPDDDYFTLRRRRGVQGVSQGGLIVFSPRGAPHVACDKQRQYHIL